MPQTDVWHLLCQITFIYYGAEKESSYLFLCTVKFLFCLSLWRRGHYLLTAVTILQTACETFNFLFML